jgi:hypothetical protein
MVLPIGLEAMMAMTSQEKRRFPRLELSLPLRYQIRGIPEFNNAVSDNFSVGGVSFINDKFIAPNTALMLEINILSRILNPVGRVVWSYNVSRSDKYKLGIEFLELDPADKNYISDYIDMLTGKLV